jgi:hypothetical protein
VSPTGVISNKQTGKDRMFHWFGDLAAPADIFANDGTKGQVWVYRTAEPPLFMRLIGERTAGRVTVSFEIFKTTVQAPAVPFPGGGGGYVYTMTSSEAVFRDSGCWRVRREGTGAADAVVLRIR